VSLSLILHFQIGVENARTLWLRFVAEEPARRGGEDRSSSRPSPTSAPSSPSAQVHLHSAQERPHGVRWPVASKSV